jgi:hypothetical protein
MGGAESIGEIKNIEIVEAGAESPGEAGWNSSHNKARAIRPAQGNSGDL